MLRPSGLLKNEENTEHVEYTNITLVKDDFKWDFHNENTIDTSGWPREYGPGARFFKCFGYHPYKEIVLFYDGHSTLIAYHMNSSKILRLGTVDPFLDEGPTWKLMSIFTIGVIFCSTNLNLFLDFLRGFHIHVNIFVYVNH
jgi:hypothetical protein